MGHQRCGGERRGRDMGDVATRSPALSLPSIAVHVVSDTADRFAWLPHQVMGASNWQAVVAEVEVSARLAAQAYVGERRIAVAAHQHAL